MLTHELQKLMKVQQLELECRASSSVTERGENCEYDRYVKDFGCMEVMFWVILRSLERRDFLGD